MSVQLSDFFASQGSPENENTHYPNIQSTKQIDSVQNIPNHNDGIIDTNISLSTMSKRTHDSMDTSLHNNYQPYTEHTMQGGSEEDIEDFSHIPDHTKFEQPPTYPISSERSTQSNGLSISKFMDSRVDFTNEANDDDDDDSIRQQQQQHQQNNHITGINNSLGNNHNNDNNNEPPELTMSTILPEYGVYQFVSSPTDLNTQFTTRISIKTSLLTANLHLQDPFQWDFNRFIISIASFIVLMSIVILSNVMLRLDTDLVDKISPNWFNTGIIIHAFFALIYIGVIIWSFIALHQIEAQRRPHSFPPSAWAGQYKSMIPTYRCASYAWSICAIIFSALMLITFITKGVVQTTNTFIGFVLELFVLIIGITNIVATHHTRDGRRLWLLSFPAQFIWYGFGSVALAVVSLCAGNRYRSSDLKLGYVELFYCCCALRQFRPRRMDGQKDEHGVHVNYYQSDL